MASTPQSTTAAAAATTDAAAASSPSAFSPQVSILRKSTISPSSPPPPSASPFFLSPADIIFRDLHYNRRLLFYPRPNASFEAVADVLKRSLSEVLAAFYPWAGRLEAEEAEEESRRLAINLAEGGVEFVEAAAEMEMAKMESCRFPMMPLYDHLAPNVDHKGEALYKSPLLAVQLTGFSDGGVSVGVAQSHVVSDGHSLWHFMVAWSDCARGLAIASLPLHERSRLSLPEPLSREAAQSFPGSLFCRMDDETEDFDDEGGGDGGVIATAGGGDGDGGVIAKAGGGDGGVIATADGGGDGGVPATADGGVPATADEDMVQCVLDISADTVKKLKAEAGGGYTAFEVVCAHFWQKVDAARRSEKKEKTSFWVLVNLRSKLDPPLPSSYFGNVIQLGMATTRTGHLRRDKLSRTAERIRRAARSCHHRTFNGALTWFALHHYSFAELAISGVFSIKDSMNVASSPRFPAYDTDFGWGKPAAVRSACVPGDGEIILFGGRPGSAAGDMEICLALRRSAMKRLISDPSFLANPVSDPFLYYGDVDGGNR